MTTYHVKFDRIGRNHGVKPLVVAAVDEEELADRICDYARPHLRSADYDVFFDLAKGTGWIACGMHMGGQFTVRAETNT